MPAGPLTPAQLDLIQRAQVAFASRVNLAWQRAGRPSVQVTSYLRDVRGNQLAGGAPDSQHLIGTAVDVFDESGAFLQQARVLGLVVVPTGIRSHHLQLWPHHVEAVRRIAPQLIV